MQSRSAALVRMVRSVHISSYLARRLSCGLQHTPHHVQDSSMA